MSFYIIQCICFLEFYINIMLMRKFLSFFFVMAFYVVGAYAKYWSKVNRILPQGISQQSRSLS